MEGSSQRARHSGFAAVFTRAHSWRRLNRIIRYHPRVVRTINATTAAKHFREVLNDVEHRGETFEVERHGRLVARIGPTGPAAFRLVRWKEALGALSAGPASDADFYGDLEEVRRQVARLPEDPWAPSSTAPF